MPLKLDVDQVEAIAADLDLRGPNKNAVMAAVKPMAEGGFQEIVLDLATGVGKTYVMAGLIEYLASCGIRNVLIVTPGKTVQEKTLLNFTPGSSKYIKGMSSDPYLITPENFRTASDVIVDESRLKLYVFNVQQLTRPSNEGNKRSHAINEFLGGALYEYLQSAGDLVVIADEHHVYNTRTAVFSGAVRDLGAQALVGLTATPNEHDLKNVKFQYSLAEAIRDGYVKIPVIAYRRDGLKEESVQLEDACHLLRIKKDYYARYGESVGRTVNPVLFVVCKDIAHAEKTAQLLSGSKYIGSTEAVLLITSGSPDEQLELLESVESADSPIRAVVSVNKLKEGWDVKNIAVIVALRALASETLTEQVLGRGLRLPFGSRTGVDLIDQVDIVSHDSYRQLLRQKDLLVEKMTTPDSPTRPVISIPGFEPGDDPEAAEQPFPDSGLPSQGEFRLVSQPEVEKNGQEAAVGASELLLVEDLDSRLQGNSQQVDWLRLANGWEFIDFPRRDLKIVERRFSLELISDESAYHAGQLSSAATETPLLRDALETAEGLDHSLTIRVTAQSNISASVQFIPFASVVEQLQNQMLGLDYVPSRLTEVEQAKRIVSQFLRGAGADPNKTLEWDVVRSHRAINNISKLVSDAYRNTSFKPEYVWTLIKVPVMPAHPVQIEGRYQGGFRRGAFYSGWQLSMTSAVSFDAKDTELLMADIFDRSRTYVKGWSRVYNPGDVYLPHKSGRRYYPDFIVVAEDGTKWLFEGKADDPQKPEKVIEDRQLATEWVQAVKNDGRFGSWKYAFCSESGIAAANYGWSGLLAGASVSDGAADELTS